MRKVHAKCSGRGLANFTAPNSGPLLLFDLRDRSRNLNPPSAAQIAVCLTAKLTLTIVRPYGSVYFDQDENVGCWGASLGSFQHAKTYAPVKTVKAEGLDVRSGMRAGLAVRALFPSHVLDDLASDDLMLVRRILQQPSLRPPKCRSISGMPFSRWLKLSRGPRGSSRKCRNTWLFESVSRPRSTSCQPRPF